jgi:cytochrome c553
MTFKHSLGVAALFASTVAFAQPQPAVPATPAPVAPAAAAPASASGSATVTPLAATPAAPTEALTDAHAPAKWGDPKVGQTKATACGACHGLDGNSADAQYPKLASQQERRTCAMSARISPARKSCPAWPTTA